MEIRPPDFRLERSGVMVSIWEETTPWHGVRWKMVVKDTMLRGGGVDRTVICLMDNLSESLYQVTALSEILVEARAWIEARKRHWAIEAGNIQREIEKERRKRERAEIRRVKRLRTRYVDFYDKN